MKSDRKGTIADFYDRVAPAYGSVGATFLSQAGHLMIDAAALTPGARVLDVGCGRGASLFPAAAAVGTTGTVIGVDLAGAMVRETALEAQRRSLTNAALLRMDAEALAFRDSCFDAVLCGFTIFFLDLERALSEFHRVLCTGGCLAIGLADGSDPAWQWYNDLLVAYGERYQVSLSPPQAGSAWKRSELPAFLQCAGFADVRVLVEAHDATYADEQAWWQAKWTHGARYPLERMSDEVLARFKADAFARLAGHKLTDGFHEEFRLQCVIGTKPAL